MEEVEEELKNLSRKIRSAKKKKSPGFTTSIFFLAGEYWGHRELPKRPLKDFQPMNEFLSLLVVLFVRKMNKSHIEEKDVYRASRHVLPIDCLDQADMYYDRRLESGLSATDTTIATIIAYLSEKDISYTMRAVVLLAIYIEFIATKILIYYNGRFGEGSGRILLPKKLSPQVVMQLYHLHNAFSDKDRFSEETKSIIREGEEKDLKKRQSKKKRSKRV